MKLPEFVIAFRKFLRKLRKLPFGGGDRPLQIVYLRFERLDVCHSRRAIYGAKELTP